MLGNNPGAAVGDGSMRAGTQKLSKSNDRFTRIFYAMSQGAQNNETRKLLEVSRGPFDDKNLSEAIRIPSGKIHRKSSMENKK